MGVSDVGMLTFRSVVFLLGIFIIIGTCVSAIKTFVVPRGISSPITRDVFRFVGFLFRLRVRNKGYEERDRIMAFFAPVTLVLMPVVLLALILIGYMLLYWAIEPRDIYPIFEISGSSLLTLGSEEVETTASKILEFTEATIGLILIALLIAYLPTMYSAFSARETAVSMWDARAGSPPTVVEMVARSYRTQELGNLRDEWISWEIWFAQLEESHTSLAPLAFFRSPVPNRHWVTACGNVLDSAAFILTAVDVPFQPKAAFCVRSGFLALRQIADYFEIEYDPNPAKDDPISISRFEFDEVYDNLATQGVPMNPDRESAWENFCGWRVNYDTVILRLADMTMAPYASWISDRSAVSMQKEKTPKFFKIFRG